MTLRRSRARGSRRLVSLALSGALFAFAFATATATGAGADTRITEPTAGPIHVALDPAGKPVPFTIVAKGFSAGHLVFIEQCDGRPPSAPNWTPARDCDVGGAPAPVIVDSQGNARFSATDPNHRFQPVLGESPETLFNCVQPAGPKPSNLLTNYTTCQIRVSSNNVQATDDQVFAAIVFGSTSSGAGSSRAGLIGGIFAGVLVVVAGAAFLRSRRNRSGERLAEHR
jgi:hypothetical protein